MAAAKIRVAIDEVKLQAARRAAKREGVSLAAYIARAVEKQLDEQNRLDAARELWASWDEASTPTVADRAAFRRRMRHVSRARRT